MRAFIRQKTRRHCSAQARCQCSWRAQALAVALLCAGNLVAHEMSFNSSITYSGTQPTGGTDSIANWVGAAFDADNIGGSGENADGGSNNGTVNDNYTYIARYPVPTQGQTFTTGGNPDGYNLSAITIQIAGYSNNIATGSNRTTWDLDFSNGPIMLFLSTIDGTNILYQSTQLFNTGGTGNPGTGISANGPSTYLTFNMPFNVHLDPNTEYAFDIALEDDNANYFEWLGTRNNAYTGGTAYGRSHSRSTDITQLTGDRVFMLDMSAGPDPRTFAHPGTLHTRADLERMKAKVAANEEPWLSGYNMLLSSPYNNLGWPAYDTDYISRDASDHPDNYTRSQQDAQLIYTLTLIYHMTGDTNYADRAVQIANVWSDLIGLKGNSNVSLAAGICGYLFAISGELLSTYPGWAEPDKQAYKNMMLRVFYPANLDFLWRAHGTFRNGGNTHYRLNWETANMASMAAIGVLCDNSAVYEQAVDYFKAGHGNGRVERAAWYLHPNGLAQTEESGRDQGHNVLGWYQMALLCQTAWNQGDDLFAYDNNRVLRAWEYVAKHNLYYDVPWAYHRNSDLGYTETLTFFDQGRLHFFHELVYHHYVNVKGMAAPYNEEAAAAVRPERWPNTSYHPSEVDWFGLGTLTFTLDPIPSSSAPSGLLANWSKNQVVLNWNGSAYATNYNIKRSTVPGGPYTTIATTPGAMDTYYTDTTVANDDTYYYVVSANTSSGETAESAELTVGRQLVAHYPFEGNLHDVAGGQDGVGHGGSGGAPGYAAGFGGGQAIDLDGIDDYVELPKGIANYQDLTVAAWVRWDGGGVWQRIFDFGSEIEKYMMLTPSSGSSTLRFEITTSRNNEGTGRIDAPALPTGQWKHVAVTLNGDAGTLYVNGVPADTQTIDEVDPLFAQVFCYIGRSMWNADPQFNGRIDDFRIYNYALSGSEIYALWGQSTNSAPEFSADPIDLPAATEDSLYSSQTLAGRATDPNGGLLSFSKLTGPAWLSIASDGTLSGTPSNNDVGLNLFVVRVADTSGATDDANLWITVGNSNDAPTWNVDPIDGGGAVAGYAYSFSVAGDASDVDVGDSIRFSKVSGPAWLNVDSNGSVTGVPGGVDEGTNNFTLRATDSVGGYADAVFTVVVSIPEGAAVAYWAFEEGTADTYVPYEPVSAGQYDGSMLDASVFGNHLSAWSTSWEWYRTNVPAAITPQTGAANTLSVQNANDFNAMSAIGTLLTSWNPAQWTIEAAFMTDRTTGYQTLVGRDSYGAYSPELALSALYVSVRPGGSVAVQFTDSAGNNWNLASAGGVVEVNQWQSIAAVSDGSSLSLFLKNITAGESAYAPMGTLDISSSTNAALSTGAGDGGDWDAGVISVGRGLYNGGHTDRLFGFIDDVRLSEAALTPDQFLYSTPLPPQLSVVGAVSQVDVTWSASYTGWRLLAQTNQPGQGLGTNWVEVSGSSLTNKVSLPINSTNGSLFLRLVSP